MKENILFYKKLKKQQNGLVDLLSDPSLFRPVPEDWFVFVVDIEGSTQAVRKGLHEEVNLSATGSIVAVLNQIRKENRSIRIPYFFGGDGTTFIIPGKFQQKILSVLENYRHHVQRRTSLVLRVGCLSVRDIYGLNQRIDIAKLGLTKYLTIPVVLGNGLNYAEKVIKATFVDTRQVQSEIAAVNLTGMECRWREIKPIEETKKTICLLVNCPTEALQAATYKNVIGQLDELFGDFEARNPVYNSKLQLETSLQKIREELQLKTGAYGTLTLLKYWFITLFGNLYFRLLQKRIAYFSSIPLLSDTLMLDGTLHTVFLGPQPQIDQLIAYLDAQEAQGHLHYGIHVTHASIMSCYVEDRKHNHIHFVDGTEGGYTRAAIMYKGKI